MTLFRGALDKLQREIDECQIADQFRLAKQIAQLRKKPASQSQTLAAIKKLQLNIERSKQCCLLRSKLIPGKLDINLVLPISEKSEEIASLIRNNPVVVIAGETGSGKTTQIPKICLQAGFGRKGLIGHTQPRRLAAISVANRISDELAVDLGEGVGYQIRFNDHTSSSTFLKLMTDGILLAEIQQDPFLNKYEVLIIDEAHERSLNIDFLLGFLKRLRRRRKNLKIIITSATIDVEKFSAHFDDAPVISVSCRTYPVETRYCPLEIDADDELLDDDRQINGIINAVEGIVSVDRKQQKFSGDILVFLSSEREIRETALKLRKQKIRDTEILPLYSRLRHSEQVKIFKPHKGRRVVLATNVAETSITVPGINYVIDTGFARISRYSVHNKIQRLPIEPISQASARQRQGRCGRTADGICIRLYAEEDFNSRPEYTDPEIKRTNLASVILRMLSLRLGKVEDFPFLDKPEQKAINDGVKLLVELNAIDQERHLTSVGRQMATFHIDPRYSRMLVTASSLSALAELLLITSAMCIQDPREIPADKRQQALQCLAQWAHPNSDFLSLVNLWNEYEVKRQELTQAKLRSFCNRNFLSFMRMREWREIHRQLLLNCQQLGFKINRKPASYEQVHLSIISGSLNQIAHLSDHRLYTGSRNKKFNLLPGSVLHGKQAKWIVSGELIETSQTFATQAAKIEPQWVEQMALHLVKRNYFEPHWSVKRQEVMAYEKIILYGLVLIERSLLSYSRIDPIVCRELFIREALAGFQLQTNFDFYDQNLALIQSLSKQEEKIRRPDLLLNERELIAFYAREVPEVICVGNDFNKWLKSELRSHPDLLRMKLSDITDPDALSQGQHAFPDSANLSSNQLSIDYVFEPGNEKDGATITVPVEMLGQLNQSDIDWAVPGLIEEKCVALLKSLPKALRKKFIPINGFAKQAVAGMNKADGSLMDSLLKQIHRLTALSLEHTDFKILDIPEHLSVKVSVLSATGEEVMVGSDLAVLRKALFGDGSGGSPVEVQTSFDHPVEMSGLTNWSFETLPKEVEIEHEFSLVRYPAIVDNGETVSIELFADPYEAEQQTRAGLIRLYMNRSVQQRNQIWKKFTRFEQDNSLKLSKIIGKLTEVTTSAVYRTAFDVEEQVPADRTSFERMLSEGKSALLTTADEYERVLKKIADKSYEISCCLEDLNSEHLTYLKDDIVNQLASLFAAEFISETSLTWLREYPRYLDGMKIRLERAPNVGAKDRSNTELVAQFWARYLKAKANSPAVVDKELAHYRWMIEEFRVSLFAQGLKTRIIVSEKRLEKQLEKLKTGKIAS
ncbi:MAG: ATP-dependent RNA helicase HrpA [Gammaproteobacteria bacterium]|jgi:ATP-dependent helicase HrpA|nr:ATP-dependent RNA helicase HrpA [Gammaproteobacteria bacterium]